METLSDTAGHESAQVHPECWFCNGDLRGGPPPGGWLLDDGIWRAGHTPVGMAAAGTVVLEARRHVLDQSAFDTRESITFIPALSTVLAAMRAALGCERIYQWSTMAAYPHFHVWLLPWWRTSEHEGPAHLAAVVESPASDDVVLAAAARLGAAVRELS